MGKLARYLQASRSLPKWRWAQVPMYPFDAYSFRMAPTGAVSSTAAGAVRRVLGVSRLNCRIL